MSFKNLFISFFLLITISFAFTNATTFEVRNKCPYTVWAAAVPGGGRQLDSGQSWTFNVNANAKESTFEVLNQCPYTVWAAAVPGGGIRLDRGQSWTFKVNASTTGARIWPRTNCYFDGAGRGHCETGDCGGLLACQAYGSPPNTLAEYALNQFNNSDFFDISLVDGFNVPMDFSPTTNGCSRGIKCVADINGQCPAQLKAPGGCNNPCTVFKTDQYCCNSGSCGPTDYSRFFKDRCPDAYSYPEDDQTSTFTCPSGTNYKVVFCPPTSPLGGRQLNTGESWSFTVSPGAKISRIWGRTNCNIDAADRTKCQTGDCSGILECQIYGAPPLTLAEIALNGSLNLDYMKISLINGFNIPLKLGPATNVCSTIQCSADINGQCPEDLQTSGGCYSACDVFKTNEFCCNMGKCGPTEYSRFFKKRCPNAYSYPRDDYLTATFTCPAGTNYRVVFCP